MKCGALIVTAIALALPVLSAPPAAFSAEVTAPPRHHHLRVRDDRRSGHPSGLSTTAKISHDEPESLERETTRNPKAADMNAKTEAPAVRPSAEWDCNNGDGGCTWEPYGWRGTAN